VVLSQVCRNRRRNGRGRQSAFGGYFVRKVVRDRNWLN
jgi:hypothetical protein